MLLKTGSSSPAGRFRQAASISVKRRPEHWAKERGAARISPRAEMDKAEIFGGDFFACLQRDGLGPVP